MPTITLLAIDNAINKWSDEDNKLLLFYTKKKKVVTTHSYNVISTIKSLIIKKLDTLV